MSAADGWVPIGPSCIYNGTVWSTNRAPTSGRVTALVVDPTDAKTVYAGTATGGVWKTSDGGQTWQPMMDDQLSMSVGALALEPKNNPRLYVGTGESNDAGEALQGAGIFIYSGGSWTLKGYAELNGQRVSRIFIDSSGAKNRLLVGSDAGLFESLDDGDSFTKIFAGRVDDLAYNPASALLFIAAHGDNVYVRPGAGTPVKVGEGQAGVCNAAGIGRIAVSRCDSQPTNIYAVFGKNLPKDTGLFGIWFSDDAGMKWRPRNLPSGTLVNSYYNLVLAVDPDDPNTLYLGEKNLWKSVDGANSWTCVSAASGKSPGIHADQHAVAFSKPDATTKKKDVWVGNDGGVWVSKDQGNTFFHRNRGLATLQYYAIAQHPAEATVLLAGAQDNGTQRYEGSPTWDLTYGGDGFYCAIDPEEPKRCYASYCYINPADGSISAIQRSEKYGAPGSWSYIVNKITNTFPEAYPFYTPFVVDPKDHHVLYLGTNRLYRTSNFGESWDSAFDLSALPPKTFETGTTPGTSITAIAVDPSDNTNIYVGTYDGRLFLCHFEGGVNYHVSNLTAAGVGGEVISDITVPPAGWAGMPGTPLVSPVIVALGSPQLAASKVTPRPAGRIFVNHGTLDNRTWKELRDSSDHNLDLTISGQAFPYIGNPVNAIAIDPTTTPFTVYIGCNIGVFKRSGIADGQNWQPYKDNLPNVPVTDLQFHAKKKLLRAATMGRSVWERAIGTIPTKTVDLYIRHNIVDNGRTTPTTPTPDTAVDPTSGDQVTPFSGANIKVDTPFLSIGKFQTPASTIDFTETGAPDYIAFAQFTTGHLFQGTTSKIYVQVENRGPDPANNVYVRAFVGPMSSVDKPLPNNFWTSFPTGDPDQSPWKPVDQASKCPTPLRPGEPWVVKWDFKLPSWSGDAGILVCATCDEDKIKDTNPSLIPKEVAANNKMVALRQVSTHLSAGETAAAVFIALGIAALIGGGIGLGYVLAKKK